MSARVYTWRDAGLHSRALRTLNAGGALLRAFGLQRPRVDPQSIRAAAIARAGSSDFGADTWSEPLAVLCESIDRETRLTTFGRMAVRGLIVSALANRLKLEDWAKQHPEVREEKIEAPWIILGMPRTGTSLLSILMGLDPCARPLISWEASSPVPPPDLATHAEDPRIASDAKTFGQLTDLNPPIQAMHPFGATLATECVTLLVFDLRALSLETQALMPGYGSWLEHCDMTSAYGYHRLALQVLQSRIPTQAWVLKTPNHLWCLDVVRATYPDARLVWTHRDPRKVVASVASLNTSLQRTFSSEVDPVAVGSAWNRKLHLAVTRGLEFDAAQGGADWCCHVQYREIVADPIAAVRRIYAHFGADVHPLHATRMETWMRDRPQEVFGRHGYDAADFDLQPDQIAEQYKAYTERFDVPGEAG